MSKNIRAQHLPSTQRLKTLQSPSNSTKNMKISYKDHHRKLDEIIQSKLNMQVARTSRVHTLQNIDYPAHKSYMNSIKLDPIKQTTLYSQTKREDSGYELPQEQDTKRSRLKMFFDNHAFLLQSWKKQEKAEKQKFKKKLKLAAIQAERSIGKSQPTNKKQLFKSPKREKSKDIRLSTKSLPKHYHLKKLQIRDSIQKQRNKEEQTFKHSIQNLISLMEQNKKQLIRSRKHLHKSSKIDEDDKSFKIQSRKKLVKEIQDQLMRQQKEKKQQKLQRYRMQLEKQLQQQIFLQRDKKNSGLSPYNEDRRDKSKISKLIVEVNPQKKSRASQRGVIKSKSMVQLDALQKLSRVQVQGLTEADNEKEQGLPARVFHK